MGCDLRGCADSAGVTVLYSTGATRTHNPLVLGSNPSGPTNQPVEATVVRTTGAITRAGLIGRLKLFSQLFERRFLLQTSSERRIDRSYSDKTATVSVSNIQEPDGSYQSPSPCVVS